MTLRAQSFAALIVADAKLDRVRAAASNLGAIVGVDAETAIGGTIEDIVGEEAAHVSRNALGYPLIDQIGEVIAFTGANQRRLEAVAFASGDAAFIEISEAAEAPRAVNLLARFAASLPGEARPLTAAADAVRMISRCDQAVAFHRGAVSPGAEKTSAATALAALVANETRAIAMLADADAPVNGFCGDVRGVRAPFALSLSHEPNLSRFAAQMRARGAIIARSGDLSVIGWSERAVEIAPEALRIASLACAFASSALDARARSG